MSLADTHPEPPVGQVLDVLTLNVWGLPWPLSRQRGQRFSRILRQLAGRQDHLIGLQELWGGTHRLLDGLGIHLPHRGKDSGLGLAGGFVPVDKPRVHHFSWGRGPDSLKAKGVLEATVELPALGAVRVLVTHLQAGRRHAAVRAFQVDEMLELASRLPGATVLLGDFNLYGDEAEDQASAQRLQDEGFADAAEGREVPTFVSSNPFVARNRAERFDRVLFRGGPTLSVEAEDAVVLDQGPALSDHHPLWARLRVRRRS